MSGHIPWAHRTSGMFGRKLVPGSTPTMISTRQPGPKICCLTESTARQIHSFESLLAVIFCRRLGIRTDIFIYDLFVNATNVHVTNGRQPRIEGSFNHNRSVTQSQGGLPPPTNAMSGCTFQTALAAVQTWLQHRGWRSRRCGNKFRYSGGCFDRRQGLCLVQSAAQ